MTTAIDTPWFAGRAWLALAVAVSAILPSAAYAQSAEAESLFRDAKRLMKKGDYVHACEKFEASDRVEPTASTELNLAACREKNGQIASAWAAFVKAATTAKRAGDARREAEGNRRAAALEPKLVYLTIDVPADSRIDGLVVKRNDQAIDPALWDQRVAVDPGDYAIAADAPDHEPWSTTVVVQTRSKKVEVPVLDERPEARRAHRAVAATGDRAATDAPAAERAPETAEAVPAGLTTRRKVSLVLAATGIVAVGVGVGLGLHANSLERDVDRTCPGTACTSASAVDLNRSARNDALIANVGFALGGAAIAAAAALWLFGGAPAASHETAAIVPTLGAGRVGFSFARQF